MKSLTVLVFCAACLLATPVLALQQDGDATWGQQDEDSRFWDCDFPGRYETYEPPKDVEYASFDQFPLFETSFLPEVQRAGRELQFD